MVWWLALFQVAQAGAWTRAPDSYYAKLGADGYWAMNWDQVGSSATSQDRFLGQQYGVFAEVGLPTPHPMQISVNAPLSVGTLWFRRVSAGQAAEGSATVTRLGDLRVMPQVALHRNAPVAAAVEVKLPMYNVDSICATTPEWALLCPRPGDGQLDVTGWLLGGMPVGSKGFGEAAVGYIHRSGIGVGGPAAYDPADGVTWLMTGGLRTGRVWWMVKGDGIVTLMDDGLTGHAGRVGPSMMWDAAERWSLEARSQVDVYARNTAQGLSFGVGVSSRR